MTGAAHTASTANIFQRPSAVRRAASASSDGIECTVNRSGESGAAAESGAEELEPDIQTCHEGTQGEPLEGIAMVLVNVDRGARPLARQTVVGAAVLHHRQRREAHAGFGGI